MPATPPAPADASLDGVFSAIRALLIALGSALAAKGLENTGAYFWIMTGAGSIMVVGPAAWGVIIAIRRVNWAKLLQAVGVQAGINLTTSGNAISASGEIISRNDGGTPPKQVTLTTAPEIIQKYAPPTSSISKT